MKQVKILWALEGTKVVTLEELTGISSDKIEDHFMIIGLLEELKQNHLDKIKTILEKTKKG